MGMSAWAAKALDSSETEMNENSIVEVRLHDVDEPDIFRIV